MLQEIEQPATQTHIAVTTEEINDTNTPSKIKSLLLSPDAEQQLFQKLWREYILNVYDDFKLIDAGQRNNHRCKLFFAAVDKEISEVLPAISQAERIALREEILKIFADESNNGGLVNYTENYNRGNDIDGIQESVKNFFRELDERNGRIPSAEKPQYGRTAQFEQIALLHHQKIDNGINPIDNQLREQIANLIPMYEHEEEEKEKAQHLEI